MVDIQEKELDIRLALVKSVQDLKERMLHLETVEGGSSLYPLHVVLPQVRGTWLMSSVNASGGLLDVSAHGKTLTNTGAATFAVDNFLPYALLNGTTQSFTRADEAHFDITGELTIISVDYFNNAPAVLESVVAKYNTVGNNRSYLLYRGATGKATALVSSDGTAQIVAESTTLITSGDWSFMAARYNPSTELAIFLGFQGILEKTVNTTGVPASLFSGNASLGFGAINTSGAPALLMTGRKGLVIICAAAVSDATITAFYAQIRQLLGI